MAFVIFFFLTWLFISIFAVIKKKLNIVENTFIFLLILIVSINFSWIIIDELGLSELSKKKLPYSAYLLNRSIIIPILILIQLNLIIRSVNNLRKALVLTLTVLLLVSISFLMSRLNIIEFKKWNLWYEAIYYFGLSLISFYSYKLFKKATKEAVNYS